MFAPLTSSSLQPDMFACWCVTLCTVLTLRYPAVCSCSIQCRQLCCYSCKVLSETAPRTRTPLVLLFQKAPCFLPLRHSPARKGDALAMQEFQKVSESKTSLKMTFFFFFTMDDTLKGFCCVAAVVIPLLQQKSPFLPWQQLHSFTPQHQPDNAL